MGKAKDEPRAKAKDKHRDEKSHEPEGCCAAETGGKDAKSEKGEKKSKGRKEKRAKAVPPKPDSMRWISPYLVVKDVAASLAWYERAFGFQTRFTLPGPDGKLMHAETTHERGVIMLGPENEAQKSRAPGKDGVPVTIYGYCRDVDALAASARAAGATIVEEPADQFWGDRTCFIIDPDGHQWMFATHVFEMDPDAAPPAPGTPPTADGPSSDKPKS